MRKPAQPIFLEKQSYRRRRFADAAKLLPILGVILLFLPILWADAALTEGGLRYIFGVWAFLIVVTMLISSRLAGPVPKKSDTPDLANSSDPDP